jgi:hypothetical protein
MFRNVGSTERYARLATGVAAGAAATATRGWQRATLGAVALAGLGTALTRYCPISHAIGRDTYRGESPLEQGLRDTELRRHTATRSALGTAPTTESGQPRVTPGADVFGRPEESRR